MGFKSALVKIMRMILSSRAARDAISHGAFFPQFDTRYRVKCANERKAHIHFSLMAN